MAERSDERLAGLSEQQIELLTAMADRVGDLNTFDLVVGLAKQLHEKRLSRGVGGATVTKNPTWTEADARLHGARKSVASMDRALKNIETRMAGLEAERAVLLEGRAIAEARYLEVLAQDFDGVDPLLS